MKKILAIGGAVIKTARNELTKVIESGEIEMLIHNGGSIFHDFQLSIDPPPFNQHSHSLDSLLKNDSVNYKTIRDLNIFLTKSYKCNVPEGSVTRLCYEMNIPVLMFTALGCDFWNMSSSRYSWGVYSDFQWQSMQKLVDRFQIGYFHYICMGSAVIHPEVFIKCVALTHPMNFKADVVDFKLMYRPKTRISDRYGDYFNMSHSYFLNEWLKEGYPNEKKENGS